MSESFDWSWANAEVFHDALAEGNIESAQAAIDDRKQRGIDATELEQALRDYKRSEAME